MLRRLGLALALLAWFVLPLRADTTPAYLSSIVLSWDSTTTVQAGTVPAGVMNWVNGGKITSISYATGGTATPSFIATVQIAGTNVTGCSSQTVSSSTPASANCTAANTFTAGQLVQVVIASIAGSPNQAIVQINFTHKPN